MPVAIKGSGGGSVSLTAGAAASDTTLTLPNTTGTVLTTGTAVTAAQGGTGLTSPGTSGNVLTSNGTSWTSAVPATPPAPAALSTASGSAPSYSARAWVNFNGTGTVAIRSSGNVTSITDNGTGDYRVNFTTAMSDANYSVVASTSYIANGSRGGVWAESHAVSSSVASVLCSNASSLFDNTSVSVSIFR
jgi:hypothetical protein